MFDAMYIPRETSGPVPDDLLAVKDLPFHGHKAPYAPFVRSGLSLFVSDQHKQFREELLKKLANPVNWGVTYAQVHHYAQTKGINLTPHDINELRTHTLPPALTAAYAQAEARAQARAEARAARAQAQAEARARARARTETRAQAQALAPAGAARNGGESARPKRIRRTAEEWAAAIRGLLEKDITDSYKNPRLPASNVKVGKAPIGKRLAAAACRLENSRPHTVLSDEEAEALRAMDLESFLVQVDKGWVLAEGADARQRIKRRTSEEWAAAIRGLPEESITDRHRNRRLPSQTVKVGEVPIGKHLHDATRRHGDGTPLLSLSSEECAALQARGLESFLVQVKGKWALDNNPVQRDAEPSPQGVGPSRAQDGFRATAVFPLGNTTLPRTHITASQPQPPSLWHTTASTSYSHHPMPLTVAAAAGQIPPSPTSPHPHPHPSPEHAGPPATPTPTKDRAAGKQPPLPQRAVTAQPPQLTPGEMIGIEQQRPGLRSHCTAPGRARGSVP
ncbi:hypothetical protein ACH4C6_36265 [Streptomyces sp. NPDC017943]|uniref:hypothetical protein n=1 Tax=Streptomyces sp. NPDC017943 TaxID=3365019 RepID=UPI0037B3C207